MTAYIVPLLLAATAWYAWLRHVEVFSVFLRGVRKGLQTACSILPAMIALLTAVTMLRASGCIDVAGQWMSPLLSRLGIPQECGALVLLKPMSGSGGLALGSEIMKNCGVDSVAGRCAAVMLGASETSLYTIGIYCGHIRLKKTAYVIPAAIAADITAFATAAAFVRWLG